MGRQTLRSGSEKRTERVRPAGLVRSAAVGVGGETVGLWLKFSSREPKFYKPLTEGWGFFMTLRNLPGVRKPSSCLGCCWVVS